MKILKLNENTSIPILGLGTWELTGSECTEIVEKALEIGYRHIDTADAYGNHQEIAKALKESKVPRKELFITTKLWRTNMHARNAIEAGKRALEELEADYIDLYLIHWPNRSVPITETLEAMNTLKEEGLVKAIGVSNFTINHLKDALETGIEITNNQIEFHPSLNQRELKDFCDSKGITITGYSPFARGEDLDLPVIQEIAQKHNRSVAQVILNWLMQKNIIAIPKASSEKHLKDNFASLKWKLSKEDLKRIDTVNHEPNRTVTPPWADFGY
ncbi:MAG: aldo/keto reductase [Patescibacteria group bacterium]|jgi:2,5-diketo-D-gluconate reductase B